MGAVDRLIHSIGPWQRAWQVVKHHGLWLVHQRRGSSMEAHKSYQLHTAVSIEIQTPGYPDDWGLLGGAPVSPKATGSISRRDAQNLGGQSRQEAASSSERSQETKVCLRHQMHVYGRDCTRNLSPTESARASRCCSVQRIHRHTYPLLHGVRAFVWTRVV